MRKDSGILGINRPNANPYTVQNVAAPMNTPSGGGHSVAGTGYANSDDRYSNVQNVAAPMNAPTNNGASTASTPQRIGASVLSDGLTDDQKRQQLNDLQTQQNNLFMLQYGGYITEDIQPQLSAYQNEIDQLNKELNGSATGNTTALGQAFTNDVVNQAGANGANSSDPYSIPWTEDQEKRKRLHDAQIQRDNLLESMGDNPTMEDIVAWGEYDATIKQLTEELGLGPKEYTPGGKVDIGYGLDDDSAGSGRRKTAAENGVNTGITWAVDWF